MTTILFTSGILILLLAALGHLLRGRISPRVQYALWLLVALRLLIPVNLGSSALSAQALLARAAETPPRVLETIGQTPVPARSYDSALNQVTEEYRRRGADLTALTEDDHANMEAQARMLSGERPLADIAARWSKPIWLGGAVAMALWFLAVNLRFRRRLRRDASAVKADCPLPVYVVETLPSPCLCGLFRPAVYLTPAALDSPDRLRHVLAHEETHYRHGDHWWALVRCACLCLYWFDPFVWWAAALSRRDCELACDEGAIRRLGERERLSYGRTLVDMIAAGRTSLLQTATTMTGTKRRIRQRVQLIARRPRTAAAAAAALALVTALAAGCAFTGAPAVPEEPEQSLGTLLFNLPKELAESVLVTPDDGRPSLAKYQLNLPEGEENWGGWLLTVYELDQGGFEECFVDNWDGSGWQCAAKIGDWYYAALFPTDVQFPPSEEGRYHDAQSALISWVWDTILAQEGAEEFDCEAYLNQPYFRSGCSYLDVTYWPYKAVNGSTDVAWTFRMVQPCTQGIGGVWGAERITYGDGETHPIRPITGGLSADDYYRQLQTSVDAGYNSWAVSPLGSLRHLLEEQFAHENVPADSFSLGVTTEVTLGPAPEEEPVPEYWRELSPEALAFGRLAERITAEPSPVFTYVPAGGEPIRCAASLDRGNGQNRVIYFPLSFEFRQTDAPPAVQVQGTLTLESADGAAAIQMWEGSDLLRVYDGGETAWYQAVSTDPDADIFRQDIFTFWRTWYDEAEYDTLTDPIAIPNRGQSYEEIAQAWVDAYEGAMLKVSPGSKYACTYVRNSAQVDPLDWLAPEDLDSFFPADTKGRERFAFQYSTVFVPENERTVYWLMAGNTGKYEGNDAPAGALTYGHCGYLYLAEDGWRCDGVGTGW